MGVLASVVRNYATYFSTNDAEFKAQDRIVDLSNGGYNFLIVVGAFVAVISLIITFISFMLGNSQKISEGKQRILMICGLTIFLFAAGGVIAAVFGIGKGIGF